MKIQYDLNGKNGAVCEVTDANKLTSGHYLFEANKAIVQWSGKTLQKLQSGKGMFKDCINMTSFTSDLSSLVSTDGASDGMFEGCASLSTFNASMASIENINKLGLNGSPLVTFKSDLTSLTSTPSCFKNCTTLTTFDAKMPLLTSGYNMFLNCTSLVNFTSEVDALDDATSMFDGAGLNRFVISMPALVNGSYMFVNSRLLTFEAKMPELTNGDSMFKNTCNSCKIYAPKLETAIGMFENSNVTTVEMLSETGELTGTRCDFPALVHGENMFKGSKISGKFEPKFDALQYASSMFEGCETIVEFYSSLPSLVDGVGMFKNATALTSFNAKNGGTGLGKLQEASYMFQGCTALSSFECDKLEDLKNAHYMFDYTPVSDFSASAPNLIGGSYMFYNTLSTCNFDAPALQNGEGMFYGSNITTIGSVDGSTPFNFPALTNGKQMFRQSKLEGFVDLNANAVTDANYMFANSHVVTFYGTMPSITNAQYMFQNCSELTTFKCNSLMNSLSNVTMMFAGCTNLTSWSCPEGTTNTKLKTANNFCPDSKLDLESLVSMCKFFEGCTAITNKETPISIGINGNAIISGDLNEYFQSGSQSTDNGVRVETRKLIDGNQSFAIRFNK